MNKNNLLLDKYKSMLELLDFGIECGDGWYDILDTLLSDITKFYQENHPDEIDDFKVLQVKEKYGTLRFYVSGTYDEVFDMIDWAELESENTCEKCGKPGILRCDNYWYYTACDDCARKRK